MRSYRKLLALTVSLLALFLFPAAASALPPLINPGSKSFGDVQAGTQTSAVTFTVQPLLLPPPPSVTINQVSLSGSDPGVFTIDSDNCTGVSLTFPAMCTVTVRANPLSAGLKTAQLQVQSSQGTASANLDVTGRAGPLSAATDPMNFSPQPYYWNSYAYNWISTGTWGATINDVEISGPDAALFSIDYTDCGGFLYPWTGCSVNVMFTPTEPGLADADLVISSDDPASPLVIPMHAEALVGPVATPSPTAKDYGDVELGEASAPETFTIDNTGDMPLQVQQVMIVSGSASSFPITDNDCTGSIISVGDSCSFDVGFTPQSAGEKEASVYMITSMPTPVTQLSLSGRGVPSPDGSVVLQGDASVGESLDCRVSGATGEITYEWLRNGAPISGADAASYTLAGSDRGAEISCRATVSNSVGTKTITSLPTPPVGPRVLSGNTDSFVDNASCRSVSAPQFNKVEITNSRPVTGLSPLQFRSTRRSHSMNLQLGPITRSGKQIRISPRSLSRIADGPVSLTIDGVTKQAVLAPCTLAAEAFGVSRQNATFALSGATGIRSAQLRLNGLRIKRPRGMVRLSIGGAPDQSFPLLARNVSANGVSVKVRKRRIKINNLPTDTAAVRIVINNGAVRGRGGKVRASAKLDGLGTQRATVRARWR